MRIQRAFASAGHSRRAFPPEERVPVGRAGAQRRAPRPSATSCGVRAVVGLRVVGAPHQALGTERGREPLDERRRAVGRRGSASSRTCDVTLRCSDGRSASAKSGCGRRVRRPAGEIGEPAVVEHDGHVRGTARPSARAAAARGSAASPRSGARGRRRRPRARRRSSSSNHVGGVAPMPNSRTPATPGSRGQRTQGRGGIGIAGVDDARR